MNFLKMINMFLFVFSFCLVNLVNSLIVDGIREIHKNDLSKIDIATTTNFAGAILEPQRGAAFYGVSGTVSVFNPRIEKEQMSVAAISVVNGPPNAINAIIVGWHVLPNLYNDNKTHLFGYWTSGSDNRGCTNLVCRGFIQTDKSITLGQSIDNTSTIDGSMIDLSLAIMQDQKTQAWWIYINKIPIGYYPKFLFSNLTSVHQVQWIGKTTNPTNTPSPPMGSGLLPNGVLGHASYFKNLTFINDSRKRQTLQKDMGALVSSNHNCYGSSYYDINKIGLTLHFGGPGGGNCEAY